MPDVKKYHFMLGVRLNGMVDVIEISLPDFYSAADTLAIIKEMGFSTIGEIWQTVVTGRGYYKHFSDSLQCDVGFRKIYDHAVRATEVFDYDRKL